MAYFTAYNIFDEDSRNDYMPGRSAEALARHEAKQKAKRKAIIRLKKKNPGMSNKQAQQALATAKSE